MSRDKVIKLLVSRVIATKKINIRDPEGKIKDISKYIESILNDIFNYIDFFNSLPEFTTTTFIGRSFTDILVAKEWEGFIYPEAVRLDPTDLKTENLLIKPVGSGEPVNLTYNQWLDLQLTFRNWFKLDLSQATVTLASLRAPKSMMDILPIASYNKGEDLNDVRSLDEPFIPIPLKKEVSILFRADYLNTTSCQVLSDWIAKFTI